jgi:hypothetical protein
VSNDVTRTRRNIRVPAIMLGSLILIILASTLLFRASVLGTIDLPKLLGTKNKGTLLQPPRPIADLPLQTTDGMPFDYAKLPKQWSIVLPVGKHCDDALHDAPAAYRPGQTCRARASLPRRG